MRISIMKLLMITFFMLQLTSFVLAEESVTYANDEKRETYSISGYIRDGSNGEELAGASITVTSLGKGTMTNGYGFYSISLPKGKYEVEYLFMGYQPVKRVVDLDRDFKIDIDLGVAIGQLDEVVVQGNSVKRRIESTDMGVNSISMKSVELVPVLFGERDIMKSIQLLPGVKSAGEGATGFYVRGGSADQNLILLDEAPVYNASHLMGFFSVFNSDAIKDATLIKGAPSAEYGGRLSSVFDIKMKEGNSKRLSAEGGIGLISSKLLLEGGINDGKGSFMVSGRRTYVDMFLKLSNDPDQNSSSLYFYDLNLKGNYRVSDRDRLFVSGYLGRDLFGYKDEMGIDWGNSTATLRWNHLFSDKIFSNTTLIYSDFDYMLKQSSDGSSMKLSAGIDDISIKQYLQFYFTSDNTLKVGFDIIKHRFKLGDVNITSEGEEESPINDVTLEERLAWESAFYISDKIKWTSWLNMEAGLRYSRFNVVGPGTYRVYDIEGDIIDETTYKKGESVVKYDGLEPRVSFSAMINSTSSVKGGYSRNNQYIHMVSSSSSGTPFDVWYPTSPTVKPQRADLYSVGYFRGLNSGVFDLSCELYYKDMFNQVDYKNGANIFFNENIEGDLAFGKAYSYGTELMIRKNEGDLTGWIAYTLSKTEREFEIINDGDPYPAKQDRTHDIAVVGMYKLNDQWNISGSWVYNTGDAVTYPTGKYVIGGNTYAMYSERNANRMPDYHRLDLGATYTPTPKKKRRYRSSWNFSIYNAYGRKNPFMIYFRESESNPDQTEAVKVTLFTYIPSVTWNFKF